MGDKGTRDHACKSVYFVYSLPTSVCVQFVHIYTMYSAAVPSFVV